MVTCRIAKSGARAMLAPIFDVPWIHGANCAANGDPHFQIHEFDRDTFVLRQSKCVTF
jgi:hypothetical protein